MFFLNFEIGNRNLPGELQYPATHTRGMSVSGVKRTPGKFRNPNVQLKKECDYPL
jgi:hypothetical protein